MAINSKDYERLRLLSLNKKFRQTIRSLRLKWGLPENGCTDNESALKWQYELSRKSGEEYLKKLPRKKKGKFIAINEFHTDIKNLTKELGFADHFEDNIKSFITCGIFTKEPKCTVQHSINLDTGVLLDLSLKIFPYTTIDDVRLMWPTVQCLQRRMSGYSRNKRNRVIKNLDRDIRILELYEQRCPSREISKIINKEFGTKNLIYNEITRIVARLRKRINDSM